MRPPCDFQNTDSQNRRERFWTSPATARRVTAMDGGHTKSSGTILDIALAMVRRMATRDGGHTKDHSATDQRPNQKNNTCLLHFRRHGVLPALPDHSRRYGQPRYLFRHRSHSEGSLHTVRTVTSSGFHRWSEQTDLS